MDDGPVTGRPWRALQALGWSHRDAIGGAVAAFATAMILTNVLFLQPGPHPAPMLQSGVVPAPRASAPDIILAGTSATSSLPRPRPAETALPKATVVKAEAAKTDRPKAEAPAPARPANEIIADIQRELSRRGFYDGTVDGRYGPRTDAAIRDFEQAAGLKPSAEPSEALLRNIARSQIKSRPTAAIPQRPTPPAALTHPDPIGEMLTPSKRVTAVQRALSEFGYGQISPSGIIDGETQAAIEKFERERKLPITGQISHRVVRELAAITGRPLE
jgi:peptidoglycan hydrolase-like protein with peptidoglycan-binding domain